MEGSLKTMVVPVVAGVAVAGAGIVALYSWATQSAFVLHGFPGLALMAPNTALCLVLAGAGLLFSAAPPALCRRGQVFLGALVSLLAGAALLQYAFGLSVPDPGYRLLPDARPLSIPAAYSGGMMPQSAAALALAGVAMILINRVRTAFGAVLTAAVILSVFFIELANVLDLLFHPEAIPRAFEYARLSPFASTAALVIGIGLLALLARRDKELSLVSEDRKIVLLSGGSFLFAVLLAGAVVLTTMRHQVEKEFAQGIARSLRDRIDGFRHGLDQALLQAQGLSSSRPLFRKRLARVSAGVAGEDDRREISAVLDNLMTLNAVAAVRLRDARGRTLGVRGRFPPGDGVALGVPPPYRARLTWEQGYALNVTLPLADAGRPIGEMETAILLPGLAGMVQGLAGLGDTGEVLVCAPAPADRMQCFPSRHRPQGISLPRDRPDSRHLPMYRALNGETGMLRTLDYRRESVIAAFGPIGDTGLALVLKKNAREVYQPFYRHALYALPLLAGLVLVGVVLTRWRVLPLTRELVRAKDWMRTILDNVAEGIVVFGRDGVVTGANPAAGRIFGYALPEIVGRRVQELLSRNCREECRACGRECGVLSPWKRPVLAATETTGRRRDGTHFPLELAIAGVERGGQDVFIAILRDVSQRAQDRALLRENAMRLRELSRHLESVREEERTRIAREMHDELGQLLTALKMDIAGVRAGAGATQPALADKMRSMSALADTAIESVRRIAADLRPAVLDLGLVAALEWLARRFEEHTGIACALDLDDGDASLDADRTVAIYRIVQESLTNVARHAGATSVVIALGWHDGLLRLAIRDNGKGIDADSQTRQGHFGLLGIRERVLSLGGDVRIEGVRGKGTTLSVQLPFGYTRQEAAA
jgi:PAS domain S-box-containing protein